MSRASVVSAALHCVTVASLLVLIPAVARATPVNVPLLDVYSTGQGPDGSVDPNYTLVELAGVYPPDPQWAYIPYTNGFPFTAFVPWYDYFTNLGLDYVKWVAPQNDYRPSGTDPSGDYVYQTTFQVQAGVIPSTAVLYGALSSDNCTQEIRINGVVVDGFSMTPGTCLNSAHYFEIGGPDAGWAPLEASNVLYLRTTAFMPGWNTIEFKVLNNPAASPNPTGLAVWLQGEGMAVPEASTAGLALLGLAALALARRKRAA